MMNKKLPVGISDFEKLITLNYYFVDKSLLIKEILDSGAEVTLIPRPRRFGKTLNLSMVKCFFEKTKESKLHLFDNLKISKESEYMKQQGQYPVIFLTFKDVKDSDWQDCYRNIVSLISNEYYRHDYLVSSDVLSEKQKNVFRSVLSEKADQSVYKSALKNLSAYLHRYHKKKPIILIDEYDAPIHSGFTNNYYDKVMNFMRIFLSSGVKDNSDLKFSIFTGILRVAKESIFSGLNNLKVCSMLSNLYADKFGLLEDEVLQIIDDYDLNRTEITQIKAWYNGYKVGDKTIYNPWSIINLVDEKGRIAPHWVNTSTNDIIRDLIKSGDAELKESIETLISGKTIHKPVQEAIVFEEVFTNIDTLWSFLLFSGYLTFENMKLKEETTYVDLKIPNKEVLYFYKTTVSNWFVSSFGPRNYNLMLKSLLDGDVREFQEIFSSFVLKSFSMFDVGGDKPENFYHAFVLGMLVSLQSTHQIKSNRESGFGRYDVMIIPNDKKECGIIIEFKKVSKFKKETLETAANNALKQIEEKQYEQELLDLGIKKIIKLAIVFEGKKSLVKEG